MRLPESIRDFVPTTKSVGFLWSAGGWLVIGLILTNTVLAVFTVRTELQTIFANPGSADIYSLHRTAESGAVESGLSSGEKRQILIAAKFYVLTRGVTDLDFTLVFIKRSGSWALLEIVTDVEEEEPTLVLMEKVNEVWTGRAIGTAFPEWSTTIPGLFE